MAKIKVVNLHPTNSELYELTDEESITINGGIGWKKLWSGVKHVAKGTYNSAKGIVNLDGDAIVDGVKEIETGGDEIIDSWDD